MRILFVMNSFSYGGAEKLVMDLGEALAEKCDYVGIAALYRNNDMLEVQLRQQLEAKGVKTYILDKRAGKDRIASVIRLTRIIKADHISILHGHCSVPMLIAKLSGRIMGIPVVSTIHNTRGYSVRREKLTGWMCSCYVSIGEAAERYMLDELNIPSRKITRILNAVNTDRFFSENKKENYWSGFGLRSDLPVVLNVGRVVEQKNQICLLRALKQCRDVGHPVQCVILGDYDESSPVYREILDYIANNDLGDLIKMLGRRSDVRQFMNNADVFAMTSVYEGLSVSFLEALFCRLPIVVTQMPFVEELNRIGRCAEVVPQNDPDVLCRVLMKDSHYLPDIATLDLFRRTFSLATFVSKHLSLYNDLLNDTQKES